MTDERFDQQERLVQLDRALLLKRTLGMRAAAGYVRNKGWPMEEALKWLTPAWQRSLGEPSPSLRAQWDATEVITSVLSPVEEADVLSGHAQCEVVVDVDRR